jgi:hypothetical protein
MSDWLPFSCNGLMLPVRMSRIPVLIVDLAATSGRNFCGRSCCEGVVGFDLSA